MIVTADALAALFTSFSVIWEDEFAAASSSPSYKAWCTEIPSTTDTESYNWFGTVPKMEEWLDERALGGLGSFNFSLKNRHWANGFPVDRDTLEDDRYNLIRPRIAQLAQEAARHPDELAITTMVSNPTCYDGTALFGTGHTEEGQATQSNTNTGSGTTLAQFRADLVAARTAMRRVKDGKDRPMNIKPDLIIIPPDLVDVAEQLIHSNLIATGTQMMDNVLHNSVDIQENAYLTDTNDWFLVSSKQTIRGMIFQNRKPPEFTAVDNPTDSRVFSNKAFLYGADARYAVGPGLWQMISRVTN